MARVEYGPLVDQVRGRVANVVFSTWRGVGTARRYAVSRNPNSTAQLVNRRAFRNGSNIWTAAITEVISSPSPPIDVDDLWRLYWAEQAEVQGSRTARNAWIGHWLENGGGSRSADLTPCIVTPGTPTPNTRNITVTGRDVGVSVTSTNLVSGWTVQGFMISLLPLALLAGARTAADYPGGAMGFRMASGNGQRGTFGVGLAGTYWAICQVGSVRQGQPATIANLVFGPQSFDQVTVP